MCANPATKVKMQKEPKVLIETFSDDEVRSLMSAFDYSTFLSARNKMILAIAFVTGARNRLTSCLSLFYTQMHPKIK